MNDIVFARYYFPCNNFFLPGISLQNISEITDPPPPPQSRLVGPKYALWNVDMFSGALFALRKILFFVQKRKNFCEQEAISSANGFFSTAKFFLTITRLSDAVENMSRIFKGPQIFVTRQNPLLLDSYRMLGHVISRTWPIKVALIDVSGDTKVFASQVRTRWSQNFQLFFLTTNSNFHRRGNRA